ncbi:hypothetical protein [Nonomuraea bangladeshensis]|uniref:hypothetical protein n=1 Tax=Nonomuraea bangladeshensis TaxID=404385 RepID=UPI003C2E84DE
MDPAASGPVEMLKYLHNRLDRHFRELHERRRALQPAPPVFALEHNLNQLDLDLLVTAVHGAVARRLDASCRAWWLPFVVYAAEIGYDYVGGEYWPLFAQRTPGWETSHGWNVSTNRSRIKHWYEQFKLHYGGAEPKGSFAVNFNIIAWPITHAVMPTYLQRQLAQLLFESRAILSAELLDDPLALGQRLASRTGRYSERFQIFCTNESLLGQVATALLSGDEEESPYLVRSTLERLVKGLSSEQQSRAWLTRAKLSADLVRSRGFQPKSSDIRIRRSEKRPPTVQDLQMLLQRETNGWRPHLELPNLTLLQVQSDGLARELRNLRPVIEGLPHPLPRGKLMYPDKVRLSTWPQPDAPLIQLEHGSSEVNEVLAACYSITRGPWWVFHQRAGGPAVEVRSKRLRSGETYLLVRRLGSDLPVPRWATETLVLLDGVQAFEIKVPRVIDKAGIDQLQAAGLSITTEVRVQPVGLTPGAWDGEGAVEWLVGEPALLAVQSSQIVDKCVVTIDNGPPTALDYPAADPSLIFALDNLSVGVHDVNISLLNSSAGTSIANGALKVTIADPHVSSADTTRGLGIRLSTTPVRPELAELLDGRASISIDGPLQMRAELAIVLRDDTGVTMYERQQTISLPWSDESWTRFANQQLRREGLFSSYGEAETCEISVSRNGVRFASLICERGFHPLRWVLTKRRHGGYVARLIDRTDRDTKVYLYRVQEPLIGIEQDPTEPVDVPHNGGMLEAISGRTAAAVLLPPDPNQLRLQRNDRPVIHCAMPSLSEMRGLIDGHRRWHNADRPPNPFADRQRVQVLEAITTALVSVVAGTRWATFERRRHAKVDRTPSDTLDEMQNLVGNSSQQRAMAQHIARHLWRWLDSPDALRDDFAKSIASCASASGMHDPLIAADFLLTLVTHPGQLTAWKEEVRDYLLTCALQSPALIRAARFAVLGRDDLLAGNNPSTTVGMQ